MKKKKIKIKYVFIVVIFILTLIVLGIIIKPIISGNVSLQNIIKSNNQKTVYANQKQVPLTKDNLPDFLQNQQIIKDLPDNSIILLKLYNTNNGNKNWEESYIIKKGKVEKGYIENQDITLFLNSKYISELGNICDAAKKAKTNGDINYDTKMSQLSLLWKYNKMLKYKGCFGF